jgi:hypothetical protein
MASKKEIEKKLEYARGYRDALVDTWENVVKLATKGYSSRELQIVSKTHALETRQSIEARIAELEADFAQDEIIEAEDIKTAMAAESKAAVSVNVKPGMVYMVKEPKPSRSFRMFEREISSGRVGLCVSRLSPVEVRGSFKIGKSHIIWLSQVEQKDMNLPLSALGLGDNPASQAEPDDIYIQPAALPVLFSHITNFLDGNAGGMVVLDGLEYINSHTKSGSLLNFLQMIIEHVKLTNSCLVISANPSAWDTRELSQLETEMSQII